MATSVEMTKEVKEDSMKNVTEPPGWGEGEEGGREGGRAAFRKGRLGKAGVFSLWFGK